MTSHIIQVERWEDPDTVFVRVIARYAPDAGKVVIRQIDYNLFEGTPLPAEYRIRAGALASLMLHYPKRTVQLIEVRVSNDGWTADALVGDDACQELRRGVGATPVDALVDLALDIQSVFR